MARIRFKIYEINYKLNLFDRSYYVLKYANNMLVDYSYGQRNIEKGFEKENIEAQ